MKNSTGNLIGIIALFMVAGSAQAIPVSINFTGDNWITAVKSTDSDGDNAHCASGSGPGTDDCVSYVVTGGNQDNWKKSDNLMLNLDVGSYWVMFSVENYGSGPDGLNLNPAGLLADITTSGQTYLSGAEWQYSIVSAPSDDSASWTNVTTYGANNAGGNPWGLVAGIDDSAQWVWDETLNNGAYDSLWIRTQIDVDSVPEPSIIALFGLGLVGMGFVARRRKQS